MLWPRHMSYGAYCHASQMGGFLGQDLPRVPESRRAEAARAPGMVHG